MSFGLDFCAWVRFCYRSRGMIVTSACAQREVKSQLSNLVKALHSNAETSHST